MAGAAGYDGKRVVITGCYSGMGAATARMLIEAGAEVHGLDRAENDLALASFTRLDLVDEASIDEAAGAVGGRIDALFNCAGVGSTFAPADILQINYFGPKRLTEALLPRIADGGAVSCIASTAAVGWARKLETLLRVVASPEAEARAECERQLDGGADAYSLSKELIVAWVMRSSYSSMARGVRVNCVLPGPTATPFMERQSEITAGAVIDAFTQPVNRYSRPDEQAAALIFLNSPSASYVNGVVLPVDGGFVAGVTTGQVDMSAFVPKSN